MPKGVTRQKFNSIKKYYDPEIFCAAGKRIRAMARAADKLSVEERIERITDIFSTFRNPDKETVLTPWRVVNMHLGDCLGGYNFFDKDYEHTIERADNYFPSPAVFVYTLPNIVTGELAIRNRYFGETSCYVLAEENEALMMSVAEETLLDPMTTSMLCGWLDCEDKEHFNAKLYLMER